MRRLLTLMLMTALTFVSSTSMAAALCSHQDAQQHAAALAGDDQGEAAAAQLEEAAGAVAAKQGTLVDAGAFALSAFILPPASPALADRWKDQGLRPIRNDAKVAGRMPPPLLRPPAV